MTSTDAGSRAERINADGVGFVDLVNLKVFLVDMTRFAEMNEAYCAFFPTEPRSRITVGCAALALGAAVGIEAVASLPRASSAVAE